MKHLTRLLIALTVLALLASCSPSADPDTSYAPASTPPSTDTDTPPNGATSPTEPSPDADAQPDTPNPDGSPASTAPPSDPSATPDPHADHETAILAAMENIDPASFLWKYEFFLVRDDAGTGYIGHLLGEYEQVLHAAEYPGAEIPLFTVDAFTDEDGAWRSGEHGAGVDAETADYYLSVLRNAFLEPNESDDPDAAPPVDMLHPIAGMTFDYESGVLLRNYPYSDYGSCHNLIYIEATAPDAEPFDPPIQLFYSLERMDGGYAFTCVLLAYNEGYGWSTLEG